MTPFDRLRVQKETLPAELRQEILALGAQATAPLIAIVEDADLGTPDSPGEGWPPIHAAELLVDLGATEAVEPLLDVLIDTDFDHIIHDRLLVRLPELGRAVLEPALRRLDDAVDEDVAHSLSAVLAKLGLADERIFDAIYDVFDEDCVFGAMCFADYGDRRAVPFVEDAIAALEPDFSDAVWHHDLTELIEAHRKLGGELDDELRAHVERLELARAQQIARARSGQKVGRNDPCPCKSGKKYKKCCLP